MNIKIYLKSLDRTSLSLYLFFIKQLLKKLKVKIFMIQNLPKKIKRVSLLKSPHVNKKAYEQFEIKINKAIVYIKKIKFNSILKFISINKPKTVYLKVLTKPKN